MKSDISENVILFDWLTVSSKDEDPCSWLPLLGMEACPWEPMEYGRNGYRKGLHFSHISIYFDGNEGMGSCLDISGQGCRAFETYGTGDFDGLFWLFVSQPERYNITRLDVAFDDHTGILPMDELFQDALDREYVCKAHKVFPQCEIDDTREPVGKTVYFGTKKSDIMFRIYDKAYERGKDDGTHWVRVEMQLRRERALAFVRQQEPIGERFRGVLVNYVRFVDDNGDSNRWRWPMKDYWADLIDGVSRIRLYIKPGMEYNLDSLNRFVFEQAINAIAAAMEVYTVPFVVGRACECDLSKHPKYKSLIDTYASRRHPGPAGKPPGEEGP